MGYPIELAHSSVNIVIGELLPKHSVSLKIGVVVVEDCPKWATVITSLVYWVLKRNSPEMFRNFLQGVALSGAEWLPPNQVRMLRNVQYT